LASHKPQIRNSAPRATKRARRLRRAMSESEKLLWGALRRKAIRFKAKRQHPQGEDWQDGEKAGQHQKQPGGNAYPARARTPQPAYGILQALRQPADQQLKPPLVVLLRRRRTLGHRVQVSTSHVHVYHSSVKAPWASIGCGHRRMAGPHRRPCHSRVGAKHGDPTSRGWTALCRGPRQRGPDPLLMEVGRHFVAIKWIVASR